MEDETTIARDYSPSFGIPPIECLIIDRDDHLDSLASNAEAIRMMIILM